MKTRKLISFFVAIISIGLSINNTRGQVSNVFVPLNSNSVRLSGYLDNDIRLSINSWSIGKVPYNSFADFFSTQRQIFAAGEAWGKAVRAASLYYWYYNDKNLKTILDSTVQYLLTKERPNGSISCSAPELQPDSKGGDLWERKYVLLGLENYYTYVNRDSAVLKSLIRQLDCLISQVGKEPKVRIFDLGWSWNNIESSTILEPVMRIYNITKFQRYLDFATYVVGEGGAKGYNLIDEAFNNVEPHKMAGGIYPKAYEMLSLFEGLIEYYRVTGNEKIRQAAVNLYNNIRTREITIIGNGGSDMPYCPHCQGECWGNTAYEQTNPAIKRMMETCPGVTWLKYCSQILRLTGDPSAVDMMEQFIYNGLIGAQKPSGDKFSYMNLLNGIKNDPQGWGVTFDERKYTCCDLNGPMGLAYIPYVAVMNSPSGPAVNLYNAGEFRFITPGQQQAKIIITSDYPVTGKIKIGLQIDRPEEFGLKIRIPGWSSNSVLKLNGKTESVKPGSYKALAKKWTNQDEIVLSLDMRCRIIKSPNGDNHQALIYGPVVLSRDENMDKNYSQPVNIISKNGYVDVIREKSFYDAVRLQFKVPTSKGNIRMVDWASVDNWNGRHICTWLPME